MKATFPATSAAAWVAQPHAPTSVAPPSQVPEGLAMAVSPLGYCALVDPKTGRRPSLGAPLPYAAGAMPAPQKPGEHVDGPRLIAILNAELNALNVQAGVRIAAVIDVPAQRVTFTGAEGVPELALNACIARAVARARQERPLVETWNPCAASAGRMGAERAAVAGMQRTRSAGAAMAGARSPMRLDTIAALPLPARRRPLKQPRQDVACESHGAHASLPEPLHQAVCLMACGDGAGKRHAGAAAGSSAIIQVPAAPRAGEDGIAHAGGNKRARRTH